MKRRKIVLGLLMVLALVVCPVMAVPVMAQFTFTGDAEHDFDPDKDPSVSVCTDPNGKNVRLNTITVSPLPPDPDRSSGWDIKDVRLKYDPAEDILYIGLNSYETIGDVDSDGFEGIKSYGQGLDLPDLGGGDGGGEYVLVYFDLNQDSRWDVIAGVPEQAAFSGFTVNTAVGNTSAQAGFGSTNLSVTHLGDRFWNPTLGTEKGDLEFEIKNFSVLTRQVEDAQLGAFTVGAAMGSGPDVDVIEDIMIGAVSLFIPPPVGGTAFPIDKLGILAPWAILVGCAGVVTLLMIRRRRQA